MSSIRRTLGVTAVLGMAISAPLQAQGARPAAPDATGLATEVGGFPRGAPGTGGSPIAFGANWGDVYAGALLQAPMRYSTGSDAGAGIGFGLADAHDIVGIELNLVPLTTVQPGATNRVQFAAKLHKLLPDGWGIAAGVQNVYLTNSQNNATIYGVVSKSVRPSGSYDLQVGHILGRSGKRGVPVSRKTVLRCNYTVGAFGSVALRVMDQLAVIVDWPGQDLNAGLMIQPIPRFSARDLAIGRLSLHRSGGDTRFWNQTGAAAIGSRGGVCAEILAG